MTVIALAPRVSLEGQKWFQQTGLGIGEPLNVASEKRGYLLSDAAPTNSPR